MAVNPSTVAEELFWIYPGYGEPACRTCLRAVELIEVQDHLTGPLHRMPLAEALPVARAVYERWCSSYTGAGSYSSNSQNPGSDDGSDCEDNLDWLNTLEEESQPDECAPPDPPRPKRDWRGSIFPANRTDPLIPDRIKSILEFHTFGKNIWESSMARMSLESGLTYWPNRCWPCMSRGNQANCMHTLNDCKLPDDVIGKAKKWFLHACGKLPHDLRCSDDCDRYQSPDQPEGARPCSHIEHMLALIATFLFSDPAVGEGIEPQRCEKIQAAQVQFYSVMETWVSTVEPEPSHTSKETSVLNLLQQSESSLLRREKYIARVFRWISDRLLGEFRNLWPKDTENP